MRNIIRAAAAVLLALSPAIARAEFVIVVGQASPLAGITAEQASNLFLGKSSALPGLTGSAVPIDLPAGNPVRDAFYARVTNKSPTQLATYRANLLFAGKGQVPQEASSPADLARRLNENPNAVGYVAKGALEKGMKAVLSP